MSRTIAWAVAIVIVAAPAWSRAQSVAATPSGVQCDQFLAHALVVAELPIAPPDKPPAAGNGVGPDTCRYEGVEVKTDNHGGYRADTLLIRGIGIDPAAVSGPPMTLRAEARGVVRTYHLGNTATEYMLAQQQSAYDLTLDVTYDPAAKTWVVNELSLDGARIGHVSVDGEADGVGPVHDINIAPPGAEGITVRRLHARLDSKMFVAFFVLPAMIGALPQAATADAVDATVRADEARLSGVARMLLTASGASSATIEAVTGVIGDFPHPRHPFEVTVTAAQPPTLTQVDTAMRTPDGLTALAKRFAVEATYDGMAHP